ncbi:hypothetical protein CDAR_274651 [Caerostris darwini]|uniref:Uncharacterized protein n=1 Tax=Caerostris darwini TaxID=1538125 RepID=A0AAV4QG49_9ARAC|nr:hypothetical protein CDAR_274651 [Caerostris darwini]
MVPNSIPEAEPQLNKKLINVPEIITIDLPSKGGLPKELISSSNNALCLTSLKSKSDLQIIPCDKKEMLKNVSINERSDLKYSPEVSNISHLLHTPEIINSEMSRNQKFNSNLHKISGTEKPSSTTCDNIRIDPIVKKTVNAVLNKPFKLVECESSQHSVILPSVKKVQIPSNFNFLHKNSNLCIKKLDAENETDESEVQIVFEKKKVRHFVNLKDSSLCVKKINSEKINKFSKPKDFKLERKKVNFQENTKMSIVSPEKEISHESISKKLISVNILENTKKINAESSIKFSNHELHFRSERKKENFRDNIKSTCINELKQPVCSLKCDTQFTSLKKKEDTINDLHDKKRNEYKKSRSLVEYESQLASKSLNDIFNLSGVKNQDIFLPYVLIEKLPDGILRLVVPQFWERLNLMTASPYPLTTGKNFQEKEPNKPRRRVASLPATRQLEQKTSTCLLMRQQSPTELKENRHCSDQVG